MKKKLGLALGSGGSRGAAHIGLLKALEEEGIKPYCIAGSSIGSVVGGAYASGMSVEEMQTLVCELKKWDLVSPNFSFTEKAIFDTKKIHNLLKKYLRKEKIEDFDIKFACVATDVLSGKEYVFTDGDAALAIEASSAIPAIFKPVKLGEKLLVDGGCVCRVPVREVKELGADVVIAMDVLKNTSEPVKKVSGLLNMVLRVFDIMDAQNSAHQARLNEKLCDLLLEPEIKGLSQHKVKDLPRAFGEGYALAKKNMQKIKELIS